MTAEQATAITLRALAGTPLADHKTRVMVEATARAIAERQGVAVLGLESQPDRITVRLDTGRIQAIGFAAELRRLTTRWYTQKYGEATLWGEPSDHDAADWWKGT